MVDVQLVGVCRAFFCVGITLAGDVYPEDKGVPIGWRVLRTRFRQHEGWVYIQRNEAYSVGQDFIYHHTGVFPEIDVLNSNRRHLYLPLDSSHSDTTTDKTHLCNHNPPERIRNRRVHSDQVKVYRVLRKSLDLHLKALP
jgi:hypothetical protein